MSDYANQDWMQQWQALTRQYWNAWQDLSRQAGGPDASQTPWHEGFEQWARMFGRSENQGETIERLLASAKSFTSFAQAMIAAATAGGGGKVPGWSEALRGGLDASGGAALFDNPLARALRDISGQGAKGLEHMMEGFARQMDPSGEMRSWLRVPAFGFLREHQEHYQKMAQAMLDYQEQSSRYNALILKASQNGFERFESKLAAHEEPGRQIDSLRALYDLWVDAAEEAYAEIALSDEFREVYGALVNAQMRVRAQVQQEVERMATDFGMPTRSELDSIGRRLHDLRRELRGGGSGASQSLAREVDALKREVASLKSALAKQPAPAARVSAPASAAPASPAPAKAHVPRKKKRKAKAAALKVDVKGAVRMLDRTPRAAAPPASASPPRERTKASRPRPARKQRAAARTRAKKSMPKVAHHPTRSAHPTPTFADRMAAFARSAHRSNRRNPAKRPNGARAPQKGH